MFFDQVFWEISSMKLRQRRMLAALNQKGILDWDGSIASDDPELHAIFAQIKSEMAADNGASAENLTEPTTSTVERPPF
jgi:hypothetical protein